MFHQPPVLHRFFFAIRPPIVLARQIAEAAGWFDGARGRQTPERLHITLVILDDFASWPPTIVAALREVGRLIAAAPFVITLDTAAGSSHSIALRPRRCNAALDNLRRQIAVHVGAAGVAERIGYRFSPHLTLGYREGRPFSQPIAPISWTVDTLELIHSQVGRTRHNVVDRWMLTGSGDAQLTLF
ncbi:2'-5' RNA ligase family protein [Sphingomonas sp. SUN019]|uniref:2'-5' RNA ligase family protein n=1 Tax=Sphingomonas sp. SUN019 TaxID=2937788 RepID=UPI002164AF3B|nr:2'-5' RNA ligase family protein [Sphingomonas sp. SUN019]UVO51089.1 2'-5' RNA ligase family protein [Sphingomonas sp. SUN019]